jgi:RNA polymerase sigma-70 factor (ECF subfamily)
MVGNADDAQELAQDAFVRALQGLKRFRGGSSFYTWLFRIGINLSINHRRRRQRVRFTSLQGGPTPRGAQADGLAVLADPAGKSPVQEAQVSEIHQRILEALEELDPPSRAVVVLRDIEQLDYAEIARVLEVPLGTVKSRLARARLALRERLEAGEKPEKK